MEATQSPSNSSCPVNSESFSEISSDSLKLQGDRRHKGEDEDHWISGEELNTEGSSDEEGKKGVRRKQKRDHKGARPKEKTDSRNTESLPKPGLVVRVDSDSEEPVDISWKPKRGSIKLPHMTKDLSSTSSSNEPPIAE